MKILSHKPIITIIGSLLIIIGLVVFVLLPLMDSVDGVLGEINDKRLDLATLETQNVKTGLDHDESDLIVQDNELASYFIEKSKLLEFISTIEDIAQENKVNEQISISEFPDNTNDLFEHPISLAPTGSYNNIIQYLADLEQLDFYLNFDQLSISRSNVAAEDNSDSTTSDNIIKASLTGTSYWRN